VAERIKGLAHRGADPAPGTGVRGCILPVLAWHQELLDLPPARTQSFGKHGRQVKREANEDPISQIGALPLLCLLIAEPN